MCVGWGANTPGASTVIDSSHGRQLASGHIPVLSFWISSHLTWSRYLTMPCHLFLSWASLILSHCYYWDSVSGCSRYWLIIWLTPIYKKNKTKPALVASSIILFTHKDQGHLYTNYNYFYIKMNVIYLFCIDCITPAASIFLLHLCLTVTLLLSKSCMSLRKPIH